LGKENKEKWRFGRLYFPSEIKAYLFISRVILDSKIGVSKRINGENEKIKQGVMRS